MKGLHIAIFCLGCTSMIFASPAPTPYLAVDRPAPDLITHPPMCLGEGEQRVCGYDCKQSRRTIACADSPQKDCIADRAGHVVCGYDCLQTRKMIACGPYLYDNCVADKTGDIRCGNNCRLREDGEVICGK